MNKFDFLIFLLKNIKFGIIVTKYYLKNNCLFLNKSDYFDFNNAFQMLVYI